MASCCVVQTSSESSECAQFLFYSTDQYGASTKRSSLAKQFRARYFIDCEILDNDSISPSLFKHLQNEESYCDD
jgi:hypothetical protein